MNPRKSSETSGAFRWVDTPWTVAAALGIWGVMVGLEQFLVANIFVSVAAIFAVIRISKDTLIWTRKRRTLPFALGLIAVIGLLGTDFWWTAHQKAITEAKNTQLAQLGQIPELRKTIDRMTANEQETAKTQAVEQGKMEQKLGDIGADNKSLKLSIEKKDATLAKIAVDQYALNFTPQVTVYSKEIPDELFLLNIGKNNVQLQEPFCGGLDGIVPSEEAQPTLLTPTSWESYKLNDQGTQRVLTYAPAHPDGRIPFECHVSIETLDKKHYLLAYSWVFDVKQGKITKGLAVPRQTDEVK